MVESHLSTLKVYECIEKVREKTRLELRLTCRASRASYKVDAYAFASWGWMACVLYIRDTVLAGGQVG